MKRLLVLLLAAALAVSLNACGAAPEEPPEEDAPELPEAAALELDTTYQIPEYADFSLVSIATTSKVQASMGGAYYESDDGTPYVDVVLDVVNTGSAALDCQDLLVLTAASPEGIEYPGSRPIPCRRSSARFRQGAEPAAERQRHAVLPRLPDRLQDQKHHRITARPSGGKQGVRVHGIRGL